MDLVAVQLRSHLKKVFSPDICVEPSPQVLDILEYACGLSLGFALISNENPNFEIASKRTTNDFLVRSSSSNIGYTKGQGKRKLKIGSHRQESKKQFEKKFGIQENV
jgi:hypothetical protein